MAAWKKLLTSGDVVNADLSGSAGIATANIAGDAITSALIADDAVDTEHIADDAIVAAAIDDGAIVAAALGADCVTAAKIGDDVINSEHYAAGSIDYEHLAANSVDSANYVDDSIDAAHYAAGSVDATALGADCVTAAKIGDNVLNSEHYAAASIDNEHLADNAVGQDEIADNAVGIAELAGIVRGKIIYGDASGNPALLAAGSSTQVLTSDGSDISWATPTLGDITGVTAGTGLGGGGSSGSVTLTVDATQAITNISGNLTIAGDLTVSGDTVTLSVATLTVEDKLIELATGAGGGSTTNADGAGLVVNTNELSAEPSLKWYKDNGANTGFPIHWGITSRNDASVIGIAGMHLEVTSGTPAGLDVAAGLFAYNSADGTMYFYDAS